jgi:hypothetical protein
MYKQKSAGPQHNNADSALIFWIAKISVGLAAFSLVGIIGGLENAKSDSHTDDTEGIPQSTVENQVAHIPDPFKTKGKHIFLLT